MNYLLPAALSLTLVGCTSLEKVDSTLGTISDTLGTMTGATNAAATVTQTAQASVAAAFANAYPENSAKALFTAASSQIQPVVALIACGESGSRMGAYTAPNSTYNQFVSPLASMRGHQSGCANALRVTGIVKKSATSLGFTVDYLSPQSRETARQSYTVVKQPSGEWLFVW